MRKIRWKPSFFARVHPFLDTLLAVPLLFCAIPGQSRPLLPAASLAPLLTAFDTVTFGPSSEKELAVLGNSIQSFISNPKNRALLQTTEGQELLRRQQKLVNYLVIKKAFEQCSKDKNRELNVRVLDAAGKAQLVNVDCKNDFRDFANIEAFIDSLQGKINTPLKNELQSKIFGQSMQNSASTYLSIKYRFGQGEIRPETVFDLCKDSIGNPSCSKQTEMALLAFSKRYLDDLKAKDNKRHSAQEIADQINRNVDFLNASLKSIQIPTKKGWFNLGIWNSDSPDLNEKTTSEFQKKYVEKYLSLASEGPGLLMLTDHVRDKIAGLKTLDDDIQKQTQILSLTQFKFSKHKKIEPSDIEIARNQAEKAILEQSRNLNQMETVRNQEIQFWGSRSAGSQIMDLHRSKDLRRLINVNPAAVGQVLISNPELSGLVCQSINQISVNEETDEKWKKAYMWGGIVVGGALAVTGIGSMVGGWLLAGTTMAATLTTVGTVAAAAGLAVGLTETGYQSISAIQTRAQQTEFERAFLSGTGDAKNIHDARRALSEFNEARMKALLALGFSAADVAGLVAVMKAGKMGAELVDRANLVSSKTSAIKGATSTLNTVAQDPQYMDLLTRTKRLIGGDKIAEFLGWFAQTSESVRLQILAKMRIWTPEKFKKVVEEALLLANGCIK